MPKVYLSVEDGKLTLWDNPGPGRTESAVVVTPTGVVICSHGPVEGTTSAA